METLALALIISSGRDQLQYLIVTGCSMTHIVAKGENSEPIRPRTWVSGVSNLQIDRNAKE